MWGGDSDYDSITMAFWGKWIESKGKLFFINLLLQLQEGRVLLGVQRNLKPEGWRKKGNCCVWGVTFLFTHELICASFIHSYTTQIYWRICFVNLLLFDLTQYIKFPGCTIETIYNILQCCMKTIRFFILPENFQVISKVPLLLLSHATVASNSAVKSKMLCSWKGL